MDRGVNRIEWGVEAWRKTTLGKESKESKGKGIEMETQAGAKRGKTKTRNSEHPLTKNKKGKRKYDQSRPRWKHYGEAE